MSHLSRGLEGPLRRSARKLAVLTVVLCAVTMLPRGASAAATPTVTTDKADYHPEETVSIAGSGFTAGTAYDVPVIRPNGTIVKGDGSFTPGWDTVTTNGAGEFTYPYKLDGIQGTYYVRVYASPWSGNRSELPVASVTFEDSQANLSQCTNGQVNTGALPTLEQCAGANGNGHTAVLNGAQVSSGGFQNWVNGNANGSKAHWKEGDFISYRTEVDNATAGPHTLVFSYDTVHGGGHGIDYLGSYDATETTSSTASPLHANYNNPCVDKVNSALNSSGTMGAECGSPPTPAAFASFPAADISAGAQTCGGAGSTGNVHNGTFTQVPGALKLFGPAGSTVGPITYTSQNAPSGTGQCTTTVSVPFNVGGASNASLVLAWGGHISTAADWGFGNSSGAISGSPYHMALDTFDGASTGSQDRGLSTNAVFFTPSIATSLSAASISVGSTVHDSATLTNASFTAGGTVTYTVYTNNTCTTQATTGATGQISAQPGQVSVTDDATLGPLVPNSPGVTFKQAGTYYWQAAYSGDGVDVAATSPCQSEVLTVLAPGLSISKTADHTSAVSAGTTIGFTVTISDTAGSGDATGVTLSDSLPGGNAATPVTWAIDGTTGNPTSFSLAGAAGSQTLTLAGQPVTVVAGTSLSVHITAPTTSTSCATYLNSAGLSSSNDGSPTAHATETVNCPSVTITKTADHASVNAGQDIGFTVTLANNGAGDSTGTTLSDALPGGSGVSYSLDVAGSTIPAGIACAVTGTAPTQSLACGPDAAHIPAAFTLAAHTTLILHVTSHTTAVSCGPYANTATFVSGNDGTNHADASETVNCPTLSLAKTADDPSVNAGSQIGFTVTLDNAGPGDSTGTTLTDPLPSGPGVSWSLDTAGSTIPTGIACAVTGALTQTLACGTSPATSGTFTLASGTTLILHVSSATDSTSCGPYANTASFVSGNDGRGSKTATETVNCPALTLTKTADAPSVNAGSLIGFTVTLTNTGAGDATGTTLSDALPAGSGVNWSLDIASSSAPAGIACDVGGTAPTQTLSCGTFPLTTGTFTLPSGGAITLHVTSGTDGTSCGPYPNTVDVTTTNGTSPSASASETVNCPSLTLTKTADAPSVNAGSPIGFTVTLANAGPGDATGTTLTDALPAGSGVNWSLDAANSTIPAAYACDVSGVVGSQTLSCGATPSTSGSFTLASGDTITLHVTSGTDGTSCGPYPNTVDVTTTNGTSPSASASETVNCPSLTLTKTPDHASPVHSGSSIGFTVTLANAGPGDATGATLSDALPAGSGVSWSLAAGSSVPTGIACDVTGIAPTQTLSCGAAPSTSGSFTLGANKTITLHVTSDTIATSCGAYDNTVNVTTTNDGSPTASASENVNGGTLTIHATTTAGDLSQTFTYEVTSAADPTFDQVVPITFAPGEVDKSVDVSVTILGTYTVTEVGLPKNFPTPPGTSQDAIILPTSLPVHCAAAVEFDHNFGPAEVDVAEQTTPPTGDSLSWNYTLTQVGGEFTPITVQNFDGADAFNFSAGLAPGDYQVTQAPNDGWDQTSGELVAPFPTPLSAPANAAAGAYTHICNFTVHLPLNTGQIFHCNFTNRALAGVTVIKTEQLSGAPHAARGHWRFILHGGSALKTVGFSVKMNTGRRHNVINFGKFLPVGNYTICENPFGKWRSSFLSAPGGFKNARGQSCMNFTLAPGQHKIIVVNNQCTASTKAADRRLP